MSLSTSKRETGRSISKSTKKSLQSQSTSKGSADDKLSPTMVLKLAHKGYDIKDGFEVIDRAKIIKSVEEIELMKVAVNSA